MARTPAPAEHEAAAIRIERDALGEVAVPVAAYYGPQTQRAVENFPISGRRFPRAFIRALGLIKEAMARANGAAGHLAPDVADAVARAAAEVRDGRWDAEFVVDVYQTGSGTSTNMNANEVIARRATELLTGSPDGTPRVHPNDHVNHGQSSNDVIPSAIHIAFAEQVTCELLPALEALAGVFHEKAEQFQDVVKIGRTHLQDATPITLGQEFSGYAAQLDKDRDRLRAVLPELFELALGGTAVGTGLNADPEAVAQAIGEIARATGLPFVEAKNHFEAQASRDSTTHAGAALKTLAVSLTKIANDIRWLGSGPRCGLGEIRLPATQPGSSIMPGKVNPVQAEAVLMVCARVFGNDLTVALAAQSGNFELNVMMPVLADALLESVTLLTNVMNSFREKCVAGIEANRERTAALVEQSLAMVTALAPHIGYDRAAALAKAAYHQGRTVRELVTEQKILPPELVARVLGPGNMTGPAAGPR